MAMIKVGWKRTIRVKEYESETLDLAVEENSDLSGIDLIAKTVDLDRLLALAGDALIVERMEVRLSGAAPPAERKAGPSAPSEPDPASRSVQRRLAVQRPEEAGPDPLI
jgi:hypothetical protein